MSIFDGKPLNELYTDGSDKYLAEGIIPSFHEAIKNTYNESQKYIPKESLYKAIWMLSSIRLSDDALSLDRYTGYSDEIKDLHTLSEESPIQLSSEDLKDVGRIIGNLIGHHAVIERPLSEIKPQSGDLEEERSRLLSTSKDRLELLDTILDQLKTNDFTKIKEQPHNP